MIQKIEIEDFLKLARQCPVLDVRSPGEYNHAHIPGAYNLPLFSDEERKVVGTIYKQQGREGAIKVGLDYFGVKMRKMVEEVEMLNSNFEIPNSNAQNPKSKDEIPNPKIQNSNARTVLVHCWRGGMRSAGVAWLLDLYGFEVYTLVGGYKSFRNWVLQQFDHPLSFNVIGGYTGSGKTDLLKELAGKGHTVIDLEGIAHHKGSAFGALGEVPQPTQEMFENVLGLALETAAHNEPIWIEDESQRIGNVNLPGALWNTMQQSPVYFLEVPFEQRRAYITEAYGKFTKDELINGVTRIQKRLGGQATKNAINYLQEGNHTEAFRILLNYYDKYYERSLNNRDNLDALLSTIPCTHVDAAANSKILLDKKHLPNGITNTGN